MILAAFLCLSLTSTAMSYPLHSIFRRSIEDQLLATKKSPTEAPLLIHIFANHIWNSQRVNNRNGLTAEDIRNVFRYMNHNEDFANMIGPDFIEWGDMNEDRRLNYVELVKAVTHYQRINML